jgi:hypothetical protein
LINESITIAIGTAETFVGLFAGHAGEFFFADFAVAVGIGAFHKLREPARAIAAGRRPLGLSALLGACNTYSQADEAQTNNE